MKFVFEYFSYTVYLGCIYICCVNKLSDINAEPHNVALGKPTDQGPADYCGRSGCCTSDLAVDGKLQQNPENRECAHTKKHGTIQGSWWSVDFQGDNFLALIRILRRSDAASFCCRMNGISITGKPGNQTIFSDGYPFYVNQKTDISITVSESLSETKFAGINISIPGSFLTLCEVQVYAGRSCDNTLPYRSNGKWISADANDNCYYYGCDYTFTCSTGYTVSNSNKITTTCNANGLWTTPVGTCEVTSCSTNLPHKSNGNWVSADGNSNCYYYRCAYTFRCANGYTITGSNNISTMCNANGSWTTPVGTCQVRSCGNNLPYISHGNWMSTNIGGNCYYFRCAFSLKCATGYTTSVSSSITIMCRANGLWTTPVGTCQVKSCGNNLPYISHGNWMSSNIGGICYYYRCAFTLKCATGYTTSVSNSITIMCHANGLWTTPVGTCQVRSCGNNLPYISHGNWMSTNIRDNCYYYRCAFTLKCATGYTTSVSNNITTMCHANGEWTTPLGTCQGRSCDNNLPNIPNGNWISADSISNCYFYGCSYNLNCARGYTLSGSVATTCSDIGRWTTPDGTCQARSCSRSLPTVSNGYWTSRNTSGHCYYFTCSYTFSCAAGYTPSGTAPETTFCNSNGKWTSPAGNCQARSCSRSLPTMSNGYWTSSNTNRDCYYYKCSYTLSCAAGYTLSGTAPVTIFCNSNGNWTTSAGNCQARPCGSSLPSMSNGYWRSRNTGGNCYYYTCSYTFSCSAGYTPNVTDTITTSCDSNGKWTSPAGNCQAAISCDNNLPTVSNSYRTSLNSSSNSYYHGCVYIFSCKKSYIQSGTNPITTSCDAKGIWTEPADHCRKNSPSHEGRASGPTAVTGGLIGAGIVLLVGLVAAVIFVLLRRKRDKPNGGDLYETRLNPNEPRLYSVLDETVRTATDAGREPEQTGSAIVNTEYENCEEIRQSNQEYSNLQI